jgi:hypothetical protein
MNTYIGTKIVQATPMDRLSYNQYRGWNLPEDEAGSDEGYLVEYLDGGKPNHANHQGYISWSPKEQFDAAYVPVGNVDGLLPYQVRLVAEKAELDNRLHKLSLFLNNVAADRLPGAEVTRMSRQAVIMEKYSEILGERIRAFGGDKS